MASKVLLIYTGGTIGMIEDPDSNSLRPFDFDLISAQVPELNKIDAEIDTIADDNPIDSSNANIAFWEKLANQLDIHREKYDGFVILHGSDTMAFTASVLSFMLQGFDKPIILTGSQLPIGVIRTDGKENLITAVEIAAAKRNGEPMLKEVAIYFEYRLYRGNRTFKYSANQFEAFDSPNYPLLATAGVNIGYNYNSFLTGGGHYKYQPALSEGVSVLHLHPGLNKNNVATITQSKHSKAIVILTYGSGNAPNSEWFIGLLKEAIGEGKIIVNVTQCRSGAVIQGVYDTSVKLQEIGVWSAIDMTLECAVTKLMHILAVTNDREMQSNLFSSSLSGEITEIL